MANILPTAPAHDAAAVTPSDTAQIGNARSLWVGTAGNVAVTTAAGNDAIFVGVQGYLFVSCIRVKATGTTASSIVALY